MAKFTKQIIKPGKYTVPMPGGSSEEVEITPDRIKHWVKNFKNMNKIGLRIPAPWRHDKEAQPLRLQGDQQDVDAFNNAGFWERLWVGRDGSLKGEIDVPVSTDAEKVGATVKDVSLLAKPSWRDGDGETFNDALTHIALVTHPVAKSDENFEPSESETEALEEEGVLACSLSMAVEESTSIENTAPTSTETINAATANVKDALKMLADLSTPVVLPQDTTNENFIERLVTAISAINAAVAEESGDSNETSIKEPPTGSREKPGPIAMSKETETQELQLSAEDQATINFATKQVKSSYRSRIENCVKQGKITPVMAKEQGIPLLDKLELAFSADGEPVKGPVDMVLEAWEAIPNNAVLTGMSPTTARAHKGSLFSDQAFSLTAGLDEPQAPDFDAPVEGEEMVMSSEEADKLADTLLDEAGYK